MAPRKVNVLLLGETGVGKTTFINMLGNYLTVQTLSDVASKNLTLLAPTKFSLFDENYDEKIIAVGESPNEIIQSGASSTQAPQTYTFSFNARNIVLNVIDTPGIGNTRGIKYDETNTNVLLRYISEYEYIDAVCIMLKANNSRLSVLFEYCIRQILKQLHPTVRNNMVFLFTNSRGSFYSPGETLEPLKAVLRDVTKNTSSTIPFSGQNAFCLDNEAFRYLAARQNGVKFNEDDFKDYNRSYEKSSSVTKRMIDYVLTLTPVKMQGVVTINESKRIVLRLSKPLIDLVMSIGTAIISIKKYEAELPKYQANIDLLKNNLFKIGHERVVKETTITRESRSEGFNVGGSVSIGISISGAPSFSLGIEGGYKYSDDIYREVTQQVDFLETRILDEKVYGLIHDSNSAAAVVLAKISEMEKLCKEYQHEIQVSLEAIAKFFVFLRENGMVSNDDPFTAALNSKRKEAMLDENDVLANEIEKSLARYEIKKEGIFDVQPQDVEDALHELLNLKYSGNSFKKLMDKKFEFKSVAYAIQ